MDVPIIIDPAVATESEAVTVPLPLVVTVPPIGDDGLKFADKIAEIASYYTTFFVLDIAEKRDGGWILIEMNDGQMSGLSMNDPDIFYKNLALALKTN